MSKSILFLLYGAMSVLFLIQIQLMLPVAAQDSTLHVLISHGGEGQAEICFESKGYYDVCNDVDLRDYQSPFENVISVDDPDEDDEFKICYEIKAKDINQCKEFEFDGSRSQTVSLTMEGTGSTSVINPKDFEIEDDTASTSFTNQEQSSTPALPPLPPT